MAKTDKGLPRDNLYRAAAAGVELRSETDGSMPTMSGHFTPFNQWTEINSRYEGNFMERIAPGAFKKTFSESDIKPIFQHGKDPQIGDKPLGTVNVLREDEYGAYYEVELFDTSYNRDLVPALEAGAYGASFRFRVTREDVVNEPSRSASNPNGIPERTITEAQVMEFGPVTYPAYAGASAGIRSITDLIHDVEAVAIATPILFDDERLGHARAFIARSFTPDTNEGIVRSADRKSDIKAELDKLRDITLDSFDVEAVGQIIESIESSCEALEAMVGIDDDAADAADLENSSEQYGAERHADSGPIVQLRRRYPKGHLVAAESRSRSFL